jgi:uncharacterized protein (TIGR00369 family)
VAGDGRSSLLQTWNSCGYYRLVGMRVVRADEEGSEFELEITPDHLQAYGTAHGGILAGLVDAAMGLAILGRAPAGEGCATVELKVNFVAGARPGPVRGHGRVVSEGRRTVVAWGEARDAGGGLLACGLGTFQRIPAEKAP